MIVIRGGGDLATGVIQKFHRAGFKVLVLETDQPTAIRRTVAISDAVYNGKAVVEDLEAILISSIGEIDAVHDENKIPVLVDKNCECVAQLKPKAVIDSIIAKKNLGTSLHMAPITIALGPGFEASKDVDVVIETMRGHDLGRLIFSGEAMANTGVPGEIGGRDKERVVHSPVAGIIRHTVDIGDVVNEGDVVLYVDDVPVIAPFTGLLRGLIHEGLKVREGMKIADIDPRTDVDYKTISDKARCLGGAALETYLMLARDRGISVYD